MLNNKTHLIRMRRISDFHALQPSNPRVEVTSFPAARLDKLLGWIDSHRMAMLG
ncbi:hypothetical protein BDV26DRAFT_88634 [Aspergillus bertholletiae]|uniref:Uncharacterized protein n=1 Tax=Aspergillus bertholletiae TaxID=1226010 RepID=A0A5N7AS61_9EURO|nr:hypothetical protein BDV26DRAFT_88634 [Aspergillus bertholletiae]